MGSNRVASIENSNAYFYHSDHLGSSSIITDNAGQQVQRLEYMPFGQVQVNIGTEVTNYKFTGNGNYCTKYWNSKSTINLF